MMNRLRLALLAFAVLVSPAAAQHAAACGTPAVIDDGWATAKPDDVGLDGARLCGLDKFLEQWPNANIHSVTVARRGKLVFERYFTGQDERWATPLGEVKFGPEALHDLHLAVHAQKPLEVEAVQLLLGERAPAPALEVLAQCGTLVERERVDARDLVAPALVGREVELPDEADLVLRAVGALDQAEVLDVDAAGREEPLGRLREGFQRTTGEECHWNLPRR